MVAPRLISVVPQFGDYLGGESITIAGLDIDAAATVDFILYPDGIAPPIACIVTGYVSYPNGVQHITVTTPPVPIEDLWIDRIITIQVTNPPYGESAQLREGWHARRFISTPTFEELGRVLFFSEKLQAPWNGDLNGPAWFETYTFGTTLWKYTYLFEADASGLVLYKGVRPAKFGQTSTQDWKPNNLIAGDGIRRVGEMGPFITRGVIRRVVLETPVASGAAGATVTWKDDQGIDAFRGLGIMPVAGAAMDFVPTINDGYGDGETIAVNDWMLLEIAGAAALSQGYVHVYL